MSSFLDDRPIITSSRLFILDYQSFFRLFLDFFADCSSPSFFDLKLISLLFPKFLLQISEISTHLSLSIVQFFISIISFLLKVALMETSSGESDDVITSDQSELIDSGLDFFNLVFKIFLQSPSLCEFFIDNSFVFENLVQFYLKLLQTKFSSKILKVLLKFLDILFKMIEKRAIISPSFLTCLFKISPEFLRVLALMKNNPSIICIKKMLDCITSFPNFPSNFVTSFDCLIPFLQSFLSPFSISKVKELFYFARSLVNNEEEIQMDRVRNYIKFLNL
ncbi:hypothetical protein RCL1_008555 [Eukaryota sp. TZLM3-RCL]